MCIGIYFDFPHITVPYEVVIKTCPMKHNCLKILGDPFVFTFVESCLESGTLIKSSRQVVKYLSIETTKENKGS